MDCCWKDSWITFELLANKILKNISNGLHVGGEWNIEKAARKTSNKIYLQSFYYKSLIFGGVWGYNFENRLPIFWKLYPHYPGYNYRATSFNFYFFMFN